MSAQILVLTATLGKRETLQKTIESVQQIGGNNVKHLVIAPSGSIESLKEQYKKTEFIEEPSNTKGIYAALNFGFNTFGRDYQYLTFINDDDYWLPEYASIIESCIKNPNIDLVYGRTMYINSNGTKIGTQTSSHQFKSFTRLINKGIVLFTQQATLIKSDLFYRIGGFDESYTLIADTKFWMEASLLKLNYKYINKECAAYTIQEGQLSSDKEKQKNEHINLLKEFSSYNKRTLFPALLFRIINCRIYIKRLFRYGNIRNPFAYKIE